MPGIFISYRRDDSQGEARHLFDDLKQHFGSNFVFMDVTTIGPGEDFRKAIDDAVKSCDALIVLIGKRWLGSTNPAGQRRLDEAMDFVRLEITIALQRNVRVIPVLVQDAPMFSEHDLPEDLKPLVWRNAIELSHSRWDYDLQNLMQALDRIVKPTPAAPLVPKVHSRKNVRNVVIGALVASAVLIGIYFTGYYNTNTMNPIELNTDRFGADYAGFPLTQDNPSQCQDACKSDLQCRAWTYVKPNTIRGPQPMCYLKNAVPPRRGNEYCISGTKR